jgi:uncharacterized membrane protein (UPF0182 family)
MTAVRAGAMLLALFFLGSAIVTVLTEWLWFDSLGLGSVFVTRLFASTVLFVLATKLFFWLFAANVFAARAIARAGKAEPRQDAPDQGWQMLLAQLGAQGTQGTQIPASLRTITIAMLGAGLLLAVILGLQAAASWETVLLFLNRESFGATDPVFGLDVGFHIFVIPILRVVEGWVFTAWLLITLAVLCLHGLLLRYPRAGDPRHLQFSLPHAVKGHIVGLVAAGFVLLAAHHALDVFDLLRSTRGAAFGASFVDVHIQRPALLVLAAIALGAAVLCVIQIRRPGLRLAGIGVGAWLVMLVTLGWAAPGLVHNLVVVPNELDRERPFIGASIRLTRQAYGLDQVTTQPIAFHEAVTTEDIARERETVANIRLWDPRPLLDTYRQIQTIRQYYQFDDVDVDRYTINGEYRQVMLAARELVSDQLPREAQSWVSQQLQYTHGYGIAMSSVNSVSQEGLPDLVVRDIPPVGPIPITRPELYFGLKTDHYVVVRTSTPEFDFPSGDRGVFVPRYHGDAGVSTGSWPRRLLFALKFRDANFLLNASFQDESQVLFRRNVEDRTHEIAPFLRLDPDPYVVVADGVLFWIQDAYTVSDHFPYAEPYRPGSEPGVGNGSFNYIRNSVKVVTNAYDGTVRFYVADPSDPIIRSYARVFPALFVPRGEAPASIRAHFRYPEGLFRVQAEKLRLFHVQDERVFYLREDQWTIANELMSAEAKQQVEPYYVTMQLPGEARPEFVLMLPFTPSNRDNMIGWLAARSDEPNYGKLLVYQYPKDTVIYGPLQIETRIDQDPVISAQFSLWNQAGSRVIRGNLLTLPMGQSNLYVEPIYLQATANPLPELKRVVVSTGSRVVMEPTLAEAMSRLFGTRTEAAPDPTRGAAIAPSSGEVSVDVRALAHQADTQFRNAEEALRTFDFARYGEELRGLKETLRQLAELSEMAN